MKKIRMGGVKLCTWCPGVGQPWYIVYAPFWFNKSGDKMAYASRWDDGYTREYKPGLTFTSAEEANKYREQHNLTNVEEWFYNPFEEDP